MSRDLSPLEYEDLEYILSRLERENEKQQGIKPEMGLIVHDKTIRTSDGLQCGPPPVIIILLITLESREFIYKTE